MGAGKESHEHNSLPGLKRQPAKSGLPIFHKATHKFPFFNDSKTRFLFLTVGLLLIVLGLLHFMYYKSRRDDMINDTSIKLSIMSEMAQDSLSSMMLGGQDRQLGQFITRSMTRDLKEMRLISPAGKVISSTMASDNNFMVKGLPLENKIITDKNGIPVEMFTPVYNDRPCQSCHGTGQDTLAVLNVELLNRGLLHRIDALRKETALSFAAVFLLIFGPMVLFYSRLVERPLRALKESVKKASGGNFDIRFDAANDNELGGLCADLNSAFGLFRQIRTDLEARQVETIAKMEKMASLGELAAAIAHEIKNPLAGISGAIQVFSEDIPGDDPRKEIMKEILTEIDRLDESVKSLLTYARPPMLRPVKVDIISVIERARTLLGKQAQSQNVNIKMPPAGGDECIIEADPERMQEVFFNIMQNSLRLMPGGGELSIELRCEGIAEKDNGETIEIMISDTGMGLQPDDLKNIFKPFFTTKHSGSGLGLAIGKNIVEEHGGRIEVESRPGLGSTFHVIMQSLVFVEKNG
ncbi:MAG: ATP-binding protein [Nitrospiraceae bacterium]|nr:ATP-binding protein [Nitrospiraceae bacterium]